MRKRQGKMPLDRIRHRLEDNDKFNLKTDWEVVD